MVVGVGQQRRLVVTQEIAEAASVDHPIFFGVRSNWSLAAFGTRRLWDRAPLHRPFTTSSAEIGDTGHPQKVVAEMP